MQYHNVQQLALKNENFRKVLFTNEHSQVVLMSVLPGEDIGREVHEDVDQVLVFVKGEGEAVVGTDKHHIGPGDMFVVPAGIEHDFIKLARNRLNYSRFIRPRNIPMALCK